MNGGDGSLDELLNLVGLREGCIHDRLRRILETISCLLALRPEPPIVVVDEWHVAAYVALALHVIVGQWPTAQVRIYAVEGGVKQACNGPLATGRGIALRKGFRYVAVVLGLLEVRHRRRQ